MRKLTRKSQGLRHNNLKKENSTTPVIIFNLNIHVNVNNKKNSVVPEILTYVKTCLLVSGVYICSQTSSALAEFNSVNALTGVLPQHGSEYHRAEMVK